ncbi:hypothetical protein GCM10009846_29630 [Agrococcus versicolor]|uniref:Uncharacterized protein n=1 Tax=Agrococcus versicolor TaxID=501482 RepID=A0ABN3AYQ5_9MICO
MSQYKKLADDVLDALDRVGDRMSRSLRDRSEAQRRKLLEIVEETRMRDRQMSQNGGAPDVDVDADVIDPGFGATGRGDWFGDADQRYRDEFFDEYPESEAAVVHHAIEQNVMRRYPSLNITRSEMDSVQNLRGIPAEINSRVHLSGIRRMWNEFYRHHADSGTVPTVDDLAEYARLVDDAFGDLFDPPVR